MSDKEIVSLGQIDAAIEAADSVEEHIAIDAMLVGIEGVVRKATRADRELLIDANDVVLRRLNNARRAGAKLEGVPGVQGRRRDLTSRHDDDKLQKGYLAFLERVGLPEPTARRWRYLHRLPDDMWAQALAKMEEITFSGMAREARRYLKDDSEVVAPLPEGQWRIIYADPPWRYGNLTEEEQPDQSEHFRTLSLSEIWEIPVLDSVPDNAVLFLWTTSPMLEDSFRVVKAWGFSYKASFVWDKVLHNMGHYNSVRHEFLLVCTRGSCTPDVRKLFDSVVVEERTAHSKKPEVFRQIIDTLYPPTLEGRNDRIELFARDEIPKYWDAWGDELA